MSENVMPRRLYTVIGVMVSGSLNEVLSGLVLSGGGEDEAIGAHLRWMKEQRPDYLVHTVKAWLVPDDVLLAAAKEITP